MPQAPHWTAADRRFIRQAGGGADGVHAIGLPMLSALLVLTVFLVMKVVDKFIVISRCS